MVLLSNHTGSEAATLTVRMPKSEHEALIQEAALSGVSVNQLCRVKLRKAATIEEARAGARKPGNPRKPR
jgi:hypothetical protein